MGEDVGKAALEPKAPSQTFRNSALSCSSAKARCTLCLIGPSSAFICQRAAADAQVRKAAVRMETPSGAAKQPEKETGENQGKLACIRFLRFFFNKTAATKETANFQTKRCLLCCFLGLQESNVLLVSPVPQILARI